MFTKSSILAVLFVSILSFVVSVNTFASVNMAPNESKTDSQVVYSLGVGNEKDVPTVKIRLVIPDGVTNVIPNVKLGWNVQSAKESDKTTEILWAGGIIPKGQRDDFIFSVKNPNTDTDLKWKVYETYQDGTEISWDQEPKAENQNPFLISKVSNLQNGKVAEVKSEISTTSTIIGIIGVVGFILSVVALTVSLKKYETKSNIN